MKILIFFMVSLSKDKIHGGSSSIIKDIALALGERGDEVIILCNSRRGNAKVFRLHKNVVVKPILHFKEVFPDAYFTPPYKIESAIEILYKYSLTADIFINFDSNFIFNDIFPKEIPIISSLHDFVYSGALQGTFLNRRGIIVVNSLFVRDVVLNTVGRFLPKLESRMKFIPNGIDLDIFKETKAEKILKYLPDKEGNIYIACPHRPEIEKGLLEAIDVVYDLKKNYKLSNVKLLIPFGIDVKVSKEIKNFYKFISEYIKEKNLTGEVIFHDWIPHYLMGEYYSYVDLTLCLGSQVESFGNVVLESIMCDTPVVVSKVSAFRTVLPDWAVIKVDYGDRETTARVAYEALIDKKPLAEARSYIKKNYSKKQMVNKYLKLIDGKPSVQRDLPRFEFLKWKNPIFSLPPWCYISKKGIYNDYEKKYLQNENLSNLLNRNHIFDMIVAKRFGLRESEIKTALKKGYLIRYYSDNKVSTYE